MKIEIDQSGKIENTNRATVVAYSNNTAGVLVILSRDKKAVQKYFRQIGKPKLFVCLTFAVLIYCLVRACIKNRDQIIIDREYPGYEKLITENLVKWIATDLKIKDITINTSQIGKKSRAHDMAWKELQRKSHRTAEKISAEEVIKIIKAKLKSGSI